jgi:hypothetical protein
MHLEAQIDPHRVGHPQQLLGDIAAGLAKQAGAARDGAVDR